MRDTKFVVCDKCGTIEVRTDYAPGEKWKCQECGSEAAWLFADRMKAWDHAAQIAGRHV